MEPILWPPRALFDLLDAAGIQAQDIAKHIGVSNALMSMWRNGQRTLSLTQYHAIIDFAFAPETLQEAVQRLPTDTRLFYKTFIIFYRYTLDVAIFHHTMRQAAQHITELMLDDPAHWDMAELQALTQHLSTLTKQATFFTSDVHARLEHAYRMLNDAYTCHVGSHRKEQ